MMLPTEPLQAGHVRIAHAFHPVSEVGGDFLDYFELTDGCVGLYFGDVSGKGLPAAMYAALAVGTLRGVHKTRQRPSQVLSTLNRRLMLRGPSRRHAAIQYAHFDPRTREMLIASAGMPGPFHLSGRTCRELHVHGIPPGLFDPGVIYDEEKIIIAPGDCVLFFTDGISDAMGPNDESFGLERLRTVCEVLEHDSPPEFLARILSEVDIFTTGYPQHDDMAVAAFCYDGEQCPGLGG
jgi:sigma-B regulation protein RsbU (phosphoserine phosphatase)